MRINLYILNYLSLGGQLRPVLEVPGEHVAVLIAGVVGLQPLGVQYRVGIAEQILGGQATSGHFFHKALARQSQMQPAPPEQIQ